MPGPACIYCRPQGKVMLSEVCVSHFVRGRRISFWRENPCGQIPPPPAATAVVSKQPIGMHSSYANKTSTVVADKKSVNTEYFAIYRSSNNFCFVQFR